MDGDTPGLSLRRTRFCLGKPKSYLLVVVFAALGVPCCSCHVQLNDGRDEGRVQPEPLMTRTPTTLLRRATSHRIPHSRKTSVVDGMVELVPGSLRHRLDIDSGHRVPQDLASLLI